MPYSDIAMCIIGMSLFFNAGKFEARSGAADHAILWAMLSLLVSMLVLWLGGRWIAWFFAQAGLFAGIAVVRALLDGRDT